jgi:hypothetical protein
MVRAHSSALRATRTYVKFNFDKSGLSEIMSEIDGPHGGRQRVIRSAPVATSFRRLAHALPRSKAVLPQIP